MNYRNANLISDISRRINLKLKLSVQETMYIENTVERFFTSKWIVLIPTIRTDKQEYSDFVFGCKHSAYIKYSGTMCFPPKWWLDTKLSNGYTLNDTIDKVVSMMLSHPHLEMWCKQFKHNNESARQWYEQKHKNNGTN